MSKILITALVLEGIGLVILLVSAFILLSGKNPSLAQSFIIGQTFFDMGIMFHLGYLTASVKRK